MYKILRHFALGVLLYLGIVGALTASFASNVSIGRYLLVAVKPQSDQQDLLQQQIQIKFPRNVFTIKQAVQFILQFSGYRLADNQAMDKPTLDMLSQPLAEVDRIFGPMTLVQGLITLSGKTFHLLIDPVHRTIAYKIKNRYQPLYAKRNISSDITGLKNEYQQSHRSIK